MTSTPSKAQSFQFSASSRVLIDPLTIALYALVEEGILRSKWLPIRNTSSLSATKSKYFKGLGGKHQPIKARSLLFAAHGKCFQGLGGKHQPIKARSLLFAAHGKCFQGE
ncbi:hypothetical protein ISCGN_026505 [Ixodes scapularis]